MTDYYRYPLFDEPKNINPDKASAISDLVRRIAGCNACTLRSDCIAPTTYNGNIDSPLMLVAEGPGAQEDEYGVPLVGKSGQLLDKALFSAGITRDRIYTSNVVKCRPLGNRTPTLQEGAFCGERNLAQEIAIIQPKVILCLGSVSLKFFAGDKLRITADRGRWLDNRFGVHIIATYHPAYLMRLGGERLKAAKWDMYYDIVAARNKALELEADYMFSSGEPTDLLSQYADLRELRLNKHKE